MALPKLPKVVGDMSVVGLLYQQSKWTSKWKKQKRELVLVKARNHVIEGTRTTVEARSMQGAREVTFLPHAGRYHDATWLIILLCTVLWETIGVLNVTTFIGEYYESPPREHERDWHLLGTNHEHEWIVLSTRLAQQHVPARYPAGRGGGAFWSVTRRRNWVCDWRLSDWMNIWTHAIREPQTREQDIYRLPGAVRVVRESNHVMDRDFWFLEDCLERRGSGEALGSRTRRNRPESSDPEIVNRSSQLLN